MRYLSLMIFVIMLVCITAPIYAVVHLDEFNGPKLDKMWTYRDPGGTGKYSFVKGKMFIELKAGADLYIKGTDRGIMFLMDPPNLDKYSIETMVNVCTMAGDKQAPACQIGPIFFNEADWAYSLWGPYNAGQDIRLEDCIGGSYRWRDQAQIAIDVNKVAIDKDLYLMITKTGDKLEFFAKGKEDEKWVSGGVDEKLGPNYKAGKYKIGIFAKSWGGSVDTSFEVDYFDIPEIPKAVSSSGKLSATWAAIKR